jgi:long-chain acyl-CoA synthetase
MNPLDRARLVLRRDHTLANLTDRLARAYGKRQLVEEAGGGLKLTYNQAAKRVRRWSGGIASQIDPGDRVVVATPNGYEMLLLSLAACRAGGIAVPVNARMRDDEVKHVVSDAEARLVLHSAREVDGAEPLTEAHVSDAGDVAALFYTSGTTGKPKGAELTHRALVGQVATAALYPSGLRRDEAVVGLPVAHIMGFIALLGLAFAGIPVFELPRFDPDAVLDAIEQRRSTIFVGVPAMYRMLLESGAEDRDLTSVRFWGSGADVMPDDLAKRFKRMGATATLPFVGTIGEAAFFEGYGMVEVGGGVAAKVSPPFFDLFPGDALGLPLPGYKLRVVDERGEDVPAGGEGELWVKGPGVLKGYHRDPEATAGALTEDGWLKTGDLARRGPMGTVLFAGRRKDVIKHGGYSVYAVEVQRTLEQHPAVAEAAVLGLPDEGKGEIPAAVVRRKEGRKISEAELVDWAKAQLSGYKVPRRIVIVDELPRTGTQKVQKRELLSLFDED